MAARGSVRPATLPLALGDGPFETRRVDGGVDGGCADVGVPCELADDDYIGTGVGEVSAEGVT